MAFNKYTLLDNRYKTSNDGVISTLSARVTALENTYVPKTTTINGKPLSANITLAYSDLTGLPTIPSVTRTTSSLTLSLVGSGATGTQISSTKDSTVRATVSTSTTANIGGPGTSIVVIKICATNDATEANWTTVGTVESDQTLTLAVVLNSIQKVYGQLTVDLPAGWYVKLVNSGSGTHTEAFISGQKTIYG